MTSQGPEPEPGPAPELGPGPVGPFASPGYWLHRASLAYLRELDAALRPLGLTHTQFSVLAAVSWIGRGAGPPTQQQVAEFAGIDRMMTSKVLGTLEERGLIERVADDGDARRRRCHLTGAGQGTIPAATRAARDVDARFFGPASLLRDELAALVRPAGQVDGRSPGLAGHTA
jgi:DNA-binding MarR family transcriptional regulator